MERATVARELPGTFDSPPRFVFVVLGGVYDGMHIYTRSSQELTPGEVVHLHVEPRDVRVSTDPCA